MQPLISEFSYGYALTQELASGILGPVIGAPVFPSLREEGQPGGGFDVQIPLVGYPLYLQFKLSDHLSRSTANEWPVFGEPYYRMHLRPLRHSDQHDLLIDLESAGNVVYYAAPEFHTQPKLNSAYLTGRVLLHSRFFRPLAIGRLPSRDAHYVAFRARRSPAYLFSEEGKEIPSQSGEAFAKHLSGAFQGKHKPLDIPFLETSCNRLLSIIEERSAFKESVEHLKNVKPRYYKTRTGLARYLAHLSWVFFDSYLILIGREPPREKA
ncbi:MAG: hypothetical protein ABII00_17725 [Elusimicrobiota bacterium]